MTANKSFQSILDDYPKQDRPSHEELSDIVVDILKVLACNELSDKQADGKKATGDDEKFRQYGNDKLWQDICKNTELDKGYGATLIEIPKLRKILEDHKILKAEKDGM